MFELVKSGTSYTLTTLAANSNASYGGLIADTNGDLFGTTGYPGWGTVFEVAAGSQTQTTLASFDYYTLGAYPTYYGTLISDANGNLFGTTIEGGPGGGGTVFELVNTGTVTAPSYSSPPQRAVQLRRQ